MDSWNIYHLHTRKSVYLTILLWITQLTLTSGDYAFPDPSSAPNVQLYQTLLNNYVRTRPVMNDTTITVVSARLRLLQLLSLDGKDIFI